MIGKRDITITITYTSDYTNGIADITKLTVETTAPKEIIEYPTVVGILEMAKEKYAKQESR